MFDFTDDDRVAIGVDDHVAHVRLTRADKMNALDDKMFERIIAAGEAVRDVKDIRVVVLSGEGRSFCAGLDTSNFGKPASDRKVGLEERTHGNANRAQEAAMTWRKCKVPVIAAVQGVCFGGGLQVASGADIRIVHPQARMAVMEMRWGIVPDMGGFALWQGNVRDDDLRSLTYTNREFSGEEARTLGFATEVNEDPLARALELAKEIAAKNPEALRAAKWLFAETDPVDADAALMAESKAQAGIMGHPNQIEAVRAFMEKREPNYNF